MKTTYMEGCGNSFFVIDAFQNGVPEHKMDSIYRKLNGVISTDAVLFLGGSKRANIKMTYFDVDRSTGELNRAIMCGNGIRCISRFARDRGYVGDKFTVETGDGLKGVVINDNVVSVNMGKLNGIQTLSDTDYYMYVGLPHYVRFVKRLSKSYTRKEGRKLRNDGNLLKMLGNPEGILHFNSVRLDKDGGISILTREGGVEDVTLACGTGSIASAYVAHLARGLMFPITVHNPGGDIIIDVKKGRIMMTGSAGYMDSGGMK